MPTGLAKTLETLSKSRNDAANAVLLAALESPDSEIYDGAIKAIIARRNKAGHLAVLQRWHTFTDAQREFLHEGRGRMSGALRDAILSEDDQLFLNACEVVEQFKEFDLVSTLVTLAENQTSPHAPAATDLVLHLVKQLSEMLHLPRDYKERRNPTSISKVVLESLERSVERFRTHKRAELIEAFVILAGPSSGVLHKILDEPHHPCYLAVIDALTHSQSAGVIDYLLRTLQSSRASLNVLNVISKREDPEFIAQLLDFIEERIPPNIAKNLKRIRSFSWLNTGEKGYIHFDEHYQTRSIRLVAASNVKSDELLDMLEMILAQGTPCARWTACETLASIPGDRGNHLVLEAIDDPDPQVQAAATRQIRDRHVPGAMAILLKKIESPYEQVREATCEALSEFSFANFLAGFDTLNDDARHTTGALVKKVDPSTADSLLAELESSTRKHRLRAIEMAIVLELVPEVSQGILPLLKDEDFVVRASAADALQLCPTAEVQQALRRTASDPNSGVQNAAKRSLEVFDELNRNTPCEVASATGDEQ